MICQSSLHLDSYDIKNVLNHSKTAHLGPIKVSDLECKWMHQSHEGFVAASRSFDGEDWWDFYSGDCSKQKRLKAPLKTSSEIAIKEPYSYLKKGSNYIDRNGGVTENKLNSIIYQSECTLNEDNRWEFSLSNSELQIEGNWLRPVSQPKTTVRLFAKVVSVKPKLISNISEEDMAKFGLLVSKEVSDNTGNTEGLYFNYLNPSRQIKSIRESFYSYVQHHYGEIDLTKALFWFAEFQLISVTTKAIQR
ncbi:hypothetical protein A7M79_00240 [Acinetobacter baumannii]|nr:hypothetical protein A7M79_00240 [Acinetobacter baumannii]